MINFNKPSNLEEFRSLKSKRAAISKFCWRLSTKKNFFNIILTIAGILSVSWAFASTSHINLWDEGVSANMTALLITLGFFIGGMFAATFGLFQMDYEYYLQKKDFDYMREIFPSDLYEGIIKDLTINEKSLTGSYLYNLRVRIDNILYESKDYEKLAADAEVDAEHLEKQKHYIDAQKDL